MPHRALSETSISRLEALKAKHLLYKERIKEAQKSPATADYYLQQLKKQKLQIKEEIEGVRAVS